MKVGEEEDTPYTQANAILVKEFNPVFSDAKRTFAAGDSGQAATLLIKAIASLEKAAEMGLSSAPGANYQGYTATPAEDLEAEKQRIDRLGDAARDLQGLASISAPPERLKQCFSALCGAMDGEVQVLNSKLDIQHNQMATSDVGRGYDTIRQGTDNVTAGSKTVREAVLLHIGEQTHVMTAGVQVICRNQDAVDKIYCDGKKPDLKKLSAAERAEIWDSMLVSGLVNPLPDEHPYAATTIDGQSAENFSSKQQLEAIDALLEEKGYQFSHEDVLIQKVTRIQGQLRLVEGKVDNFGADVMNFREEYHQEPSAAVVEQLAQGKQVKRAFGEEMDALTSQHTLTYRDRELSRLATTSHSPAEVQRVVDLMADFSADQRADLRGAKLQGIDVKEVDFTHARVTASELVGARNITEARGLEASVVVSALKARETLGIDNAPTPPSKMKRFCSFVTRGWAFKEEFSQYDAAKAAHQEEQRKNHDFREAYARGEIGATPIGEAQVAAVAVAVAPEVEVNRRQNSALRGAIGEDVILDSKARSAVVAVTEGAKTIAQDHGVSAHEGADIRPAPSPEIAGKGQAIKG